MGKLTFKGDAKKTKPKSSSSKPSSSRPSSARPDDDDPDLSGWIAVPESGLALGPLYFTLPVTSITSSPVCLALQPTTGKVHPFVLPIEDKVDASSNLAATLDPEESEAWVELDSTSSSETSPQPNDVSHVWVCTRIPDSQDKVTLRSATGKFLAADQFGQVTADREARGMLEEWSLESSANPHAARGTLVLRSSYGKVLGVDLLAGGKTELRADSEEQGETEQWRVWMQGELLAKAKKQMLERTGTKTTIIGGRSGAGAAQDGLTIVGNLGGAEEEAIKRFQARGQGRYVGSAEDISKLEKAKKKGKLSEAMLDRRVKLKSDRYC